MHYLDRHQYSSNSHAQLRAHQSIDDLRTFILQQSGLDYINNSKCYASTYHWQPYQDIIETNNKMKNTDHLKHNHYLEDVPSVLSPFLETFDLQRMQNYRLNRMRQSLQANNCDVGIFFDPTNIRYITDVPNMQVWIKGNPFRYVVLSADERDPVLLYDFKAAEHLGMTKRPDIIQTVHKSKVPVYWTHAAKQDESLCDFVTDLLQQMDANFAEIAHSSNIRLAVDSGRSDVMIKLANEPRLQIMDGFKVAEEARLIKNHDEYVCLKLRYVSF